MCKVFKLKTKTDLVTTTTDQSIVNCLIDNYDDELVITISNKKEESEEETEHKELFRFDFLAYPGNNKLEYVKELKKILNIDLWQAKSIADNGGPVYRENLADANRFEDMLLKYEMSYVKTIRKPNED